MDRISVLQDLSLFTSYSQPIDLTFNQYLLPGEKSLLVHTGNKDQAVLLAEYLVPLLKGIR